MSSGDAGMTSETEKLSWAKSHLPSGDATSPFNERQSTTASERGASHAPRARSWQPGGDGGLAVEPAQPAGGAAAARAVVVVQEPQKTQGISPHHVGNLVHGQEAPQLLTSGLHGVS